MKMPGHPLQLRSMVTQPPATGSARAGHAPEITIGRMHLRLPSMHPSQARSVTERALARAAEDLPPELSGELAALKLRVTVHGNSEAELTESISKALGAALRSQRTHSRREGQE